jgi:hypothetical protein
MMMRNSAYSPAAGAVRPLSAALLMRQHFGHSKADLVEPDPNSRANGAEGAARWARKLAAIRPFRAKPQGSGRNHCGRGFWPVNCTREIRRPGGLPGGVAAQLRHAGKLLAAAPGRNAGRTDRMNLQPGCLPPRR